MFPVLVPQSPYSKILNVYVLEPSNGSRAPTFIASAILPSSLWYVLRMHVSVCGQVARSRDAEVAGKKMAHAPRALWCASTVGDETVALCFISLTNICFCQILRETKKAKVKSN